ncbi:MAG: hypothetical protein ACK4UW_12230 [Rhizobium rhizophilum]|uniref:hypothetical protein n=1 Tax=Rhizobium TaxID=379 RepID=UPI0014562EC1|nr:MULTISPECIES: hypothetical protein [Rhizobium]
MAGLLFSLLCSKCAAGGEVKAKHVIETQIRNEHGGGGENERFSPWIQKLELWTDQLG